MHDLLFLKGLFTSNLPPVILESNLYTIAILRMNKTGELNNSCCISRFSFCLMCTQCHFLVLNIKRCPHFDKKRKTFTLFLVLYNGHQLETNYLSCLVLYAAIYRSVTFKEDGIGFVVNFNKHNHFIYSNYCSLHIQ